MADKPRFGPAGIPFWFKELKMPTWELPRLLQKRALDALEYEAVRWGQRAQIGQAEAEKLGESAKRNDVWLSIHGSYYINLLGSKDTVEASKNRLVACGIAAQWMQAHTVIFHVGYYTRKHSHKRDLQYCIEIIREVEETLKSMEIETKLGPETAGRLAQLGSLDEVLTICENVEQTEPVIDWAHLHARERGGLRSGGDFREVIEKVEDRLGTKAAKNLHCHFSLVEYSFRGERRHRSLDEPGYGPRFKLLAETVAELDLKPVIISESPLLDEDAAKMRSILNETMRTSENPG